MDEIVVGLDIGTTKTCAVIGFENENGQIEIAGVGVAPSRGMKNGIIVNIDNTVSSIEKAIENAESMALREVTSVVAGISGEHIQGQNSRGIVAVTNRNRTIGSYEVKKVIEGAQAVVIPVDREIIHVLSTDFAVDGQWGINDPVGMSGVRLEAEVHIVTASSTSIQNTLKSINKGGYQCDEIVFNPLASSDAVLSKEEKELGVVLVDIGSGTTDIVVFMNGGVVYTNVLKVGGMHVTNDISEGLKCPLDSAEMIKRKHGCAVIDLVDPSEMIEVPSVGGRAPRSLFKQELTQIIEPRMTEIMDMVDQELMKSGVKGRLRAGVVLSGGGCMIEGCIEVTEKVINVPVKIGVPGDITGLDKEVATPQYATGVGLLKYGIRLKRFRDSSRYSRKGPGVIARIKKWLEDYL